MSLTIPDTSPLHQILDDRRLIDQDSNVLPVIQLLILVGTKFKASGLAMTINAQSTGAELKAAIGLLSEEDQTAIDLWYTLTAGSVALCKVEHDEPPAVREERRMRHWVIRIATLSVAPIPCIVVGAIVAIAVYKGEIPEEGVVAGLMTTATEILKLILAI